MFLLILAFLMKFTDITKMQSKRCITNNSNNNNNNNYTITNNENNNNNNIMSPKRWQQLNCKTNSNSSSTSSGCDSSASSSSKENSYQRQSQQQQHHSLTPQQLQQLRHYQQLQQQQLQLLQQQLVQRKRLQQQLREQGVDIKRTTAPSTTLTCNQQYLRQLQMQQQQQQRQHQLYKMQLPQQQKHQQHHIDNFMFHNNNKNFNRNLNNILNNTNNNNNNNNNNDNLNNLTAEFLQQQLSNANSGGGVGRMLFKGQKSCRGMTEFSTNNDINNKTHLSSQPLQNSPRHHYTPYPNQTNHHLNHNHQHHLTSLTNNYPSSITTHNNTNTTATIATATQPSSNAQFNKQQQQQLTQTLKQQLINNNNKNNQETLPYNNSSANPPHTPSSNGSSVTHSPTHHYYRKPFNSPNNSPFAYCGGQQQQLQQNRRNSGKLPFLTHTQYQQHLNDLLLQQQQLQQQQHQLLQNKDSPDESELSEESLKQNVAIVLNNLDRYNNALRSIILNEQVNTNSSVFYDESDLNFFTGGIGGNNNLQQQLHQQQVANMATAITPESDYNSNATTPGSRCSLMPYESSQNQQQQPHQHLVGFSNTTTTGNGGGNGLGSGGGVLNNACGVGYMGNNLNSSLASSHDFTHDNSDYQWFLDYGYRDGCGAMQRSVLSSFSASYNGLGDLIYEDLAKNLDANLAEVDMESFRAEDIHSLLSQLPSYCKSLGGNHHRLQQSLLLQQQHMLPSNNCQQQLAHNMSQTSTTSTNDLIDNSFCKSELLFSPVKESHISVDSLDMDGYPDDGDIILTCKANKDNYTIAFEGSVLYSDESFYEPNEIAMKNKQNFINLHSNLDDIVKRKSLEVSMSRSDQPQPCNLRNRLQKSHTTQLQRYPSGNNNNTLETITIVRPPMHLTTGCVRKCSSLPNLRDDTQELMILNQSHRHGQQQQLTPQKQQHQQQLNVSTAITTSHIEQNLQQNKTRNLLPMCQIPISCNSTAVSIEDRLNVLGLQQHQQLVQHQQHHSHVRQPKHRCCCGSGSGGVGNVASGSNLSHHSNASVASNNGSATITSHHSNKGHHITGSTSSGSSNPPAFNLVKLFIKQKSTNCSLEDQPSAHTCMDISSGCWPSSDANNSSSSSSLDQRLRKKSMNDSGKGSALSRHDEEEADTTTSTFQMDASAATPRNRQKSGRSSSVFYEEDPSSSSTGSLTATNSPAHRRRSMPLRNPALNHLTLQLNGNGNNNNNNSTASLLSSDNTSEQLTQVQLSAEQQQDSSSSSSSAKVAERNKQRRSRDASRIISNASSSEMITRSMQTSCGSLSTRSSLSDRFRFVPPSFLEKLNNLGEENQAPIYVIYPNYALPDLAFVKTSATPDVIFSPFNYKMNIAENTSTASSYTSIKKRFSFMSGSDEDEILKAMDYKHVVDWHSLATLLPSEYRRRLKHIPEVNGILSHLERELAQKPLFCLTPPVRRNRTHICDCNQYFQRGEQPNEAAGGSSSSGSSQQPSSGYRGSSTLLTDDSEFENANGNSNAANGGDNLKQMYVYQYEQQRMDSGVEMTPRVQSTPIPMPRGILRKNNSAVRNKRNSMIEQDSKQTKLEKRRSLQEPPYNYHIGSAEELAEVFEEELSGADVYATPPQPRSERLSRKDLDARVRAENFLSSLPRNELKYYAEIAAILGSSEQQVQYDVAALKKEVSRALSQQKKVSFNDKEEADSAQNNLSNLPTEITRQAFATPPNSPNISLATTATSTATTTTVNKQAMPPVAATRRCSKRDEQEKQKLENNRFKRLQIQWELMSKDSSMLKELAQVEQTKSGGSTPTSAVAAANAAAANAAQKSRIPRPVSYPAGKTAAPKRTIVKTTQMTEYPHSKNNNNKNRTFSTANTKIPKASSYAISPQSARITNQADPTKVTRSPSRIQPPKRYSMTSVAVASSPITTPTGTTATGTTRARTPNSRVAVTAPNTPKKRVQSPRTIPRVR